MEKHRATVNRALYATAWFVGVVFHLKSSGRVSGRRASFVLFHQNPATHLEESSSRADRPDWGGENSVKLGEQPLPAEEFIREIVMEKGLAKVFEVKRVITIDLEDSFNERLLAWKIRIIQKALGIKLGVDLRAAPVNGNRSEERRVRERV